MKNEVRFYKSGTAPVTIYFPNGDICCRWCWLFLKYEHDFRRYSCRLTNEWIIDPLNDIGENCPLKIKEDDVNGDHSKVKR